MKRFATLGAVLFAFCSFHMGVSARQDRGLKQGEYAVLTKGKSVSRIGRAGEYFVHVFRFEKGKANIDADSIDDLAKKLGIVAEKISGLDIVQHLGDMGWELSATMVIPQDPHAPEVRWYFKREKR